MKKYKIGFCGHLDRNVAGENGQTLKTISLLNELISIYGKEKIYSSSTHIWKKRPIKLLLQIFKMSFTCENIVMLPDQNGVKVILPLFYYLSKFSKNKLFYCVVGAWLAEKLKRKKRLKKICKRLDVVFVETNVLKKELKEIGVLNTEILKNFKELRTNNNINCDEFINNPISICFFSRVVKMKGIEDAILVVKENNKLMDKKIKFDIYGPVDSDYLNRINDMISNDQYIKYCGVVNAFESVEIISKYAYQLFPTRFKTEGIPGSIIDSFYAGVPVIASRWNSCSDIMEDGFNGFLFEIDDIDDFKKTLFRALNIDREEYESMRYNCLSSSKEYSVEKCVKVLTKHIG
ncbi:MAG: glycosyltransferase [Bacilli bacterium]